MFLKICNARHSSRKYEHVGLRRLCIIPELIGNHGNIAAPPHLQAVAYRHHCYIYFCPAQKVDHRECLDFLKSVRKEYTNSAHLFLLHLKSKEYTRVFSCVL